MLIDYDKVVGIVKDNLEHDMEPRDNGGGHRSRRNEDDVLENIFDDGCSLCNILRDLEELKNNNR